MTHLYANPRQNGAQGTLLATVSSEWRLVKVCFSCGLSVAPGLLVRRSIPFGFGNSRIEHRRYCPDCWRGELSP